MSKPFTITSKEAADFDPSSNRVTTNPDGSTTTESGAYIDRASIDSAVARSGQAMPEPLSKK